MEYNKYKENLIKLANKVINPKVSIANKKLMIKNISSYIH